jgi:hypothetical protein
VDTVVFLKIVLDTIVVGGRLRCFHYVILGFDGHHPGNAALTLLEFRYPKTGFGNNTVPPEYHHDC